MLFVLPIFNLLELVLWHISIDGYISLDAPGKEISLKRKIAKRSKIDGETMQISEIPSSMDSNPKHSNRSANEMTNQVQGPVKDSMQKKRDF